MPASTIIEERLKNLESHLEHENPVLLNAVQGFRQLDKLAYKMGLLEDDDSYATQIPWWPLVSILGTFSAGKSTFINYYLGHKLQRTGNQAVDDKFSVMCFTRDHTAQTLPGVALDADPRFPFYQFSQEIEEVAEGEGRRIDAYLQLKTCPSDALRGKILIDSPGFDADSQRTSTLRITEHIINLSDLVLVFFDARHPEPGAMQDTLKHLVGDTLKRPDSEKFLYILNQLDTTAREDNPEDVVAAWQRALAEKGLTAGRFYTIYNPDAAVPIDDEALRNRFESKRDADLSDIEFRIRQVEIQRSYRIVNALDRTAKDIQERIVPILEEHLDMWRRRVLWGDAFAFTLLGLGFFAMSINYGWWDGLSFNPPWLDDATASPTATYVSLAVMAMIGLLVHYSVRAITVGGVLKKLRKKMAGDARPGNVVKAFIKNTKPWRSCMNSSPAGWGRSAKRLIQQTKINTDRFVQTLNDKYTDPSGKEPEEPMGSQSFISQRDGAQQSDSKSENV